MLSDGTTMSLNSAFWRLEELFQALPQALLVQMIKDNIPFLEPFLSALLGSNSHSSSRVPTTN